MNKKIFSKIFSLILCFMLIASMFVGIPMQQKAEAIGPEVVWAADGVMEALAWLFGLLGISFASKGDMALSANQFSTNNPAISSSLNEIYADSHIVTESGQAIMKLSKASLSYIKDTAIPAIRSFFTRDKSTIEYQNIDPHLKVIGDIKFTNLSSFSSNAEAFNYTGYDCDSITQEEPLVITVNGVDYKYFYMNESVYYQIGIGAAYPCKYNYNGSSTNIMSTPFPWDYKSIVANRIGFTQVNINGINYLYPFAVTNYINNSGVSSYSAAIPSYPAAAMSAGATPISGANITDVIASSGTADYGYDVDYSDSELKAAIQKLIDKMTAEGTPDVNMPWDEPAADVGEGETEVDEDKEDTIPYVPDWAQIWENLGIKDWIDSVTPITESEKADLPYKPSILNIPNLGSTWGYVSDFVASAQIWVMLWYSGFILLPLTIRTTLWALLIITIITGLLGVFLK